MKFAYKCGVAVALFLKQTADFCVFFADLLSQSGYLRPVDDFIACLASFIMGIADTLEIPYLRWVSSRMSMPGFAAKICLPIILVFFVLCLYRLRDIAPPDFSKYGEHYLQWFYWRWMFSHV